MIKMGFFTSKKKDRKTGGLLEFFGLSREFSESTDEEKQKMRKYYSMGIGHDSKSLEHGDVHSTKDKEEFLGDIGFNALRNKDYDFAEKNLLKALKTNNYNPMSRHFTYLSLIELYYKQRDIRPDAVDNCVKYCKEDIKYLDKFLNAWKMEEISLGISENEIRYPRIPSLERLTIIYEKQGNIKEAIEICNIAIKHGLRDSTKGGFEARLTKLQKKLNKK